MAPVLREFSLLRNKRDGHVGFAVLNDSGECVADGEEEERVCHSKMDSASRQ